jgi:hypothetical protein
MRAAVTLAAGNVGIGSEVAEAGDAVTALLEPCHMWDVRRGWRLGPARRAG